jgi:hypothetical protein
MNNSDNITETMIQFKNEWKALDPKTKDEIMVGMTNPDIIEKIEEFIKTETCPTPEIKKDLSLLLGNYTLIKQTQNNTGGGKPKSQKGGFIESLVILIMFITSSCAAASSVATQVVENRGSQTGGKPVLKKLTVSELKNMAKRKKLTGYSSMNKSDLIRLLQTKNRK